MNKDDTREEIRCRIEKLLQEADTRVFSLATGALALSITFRSLLVPENPASIWLLGASWIAFVVCIALHIAGVILEAWVWSNILITEDFILSRRRKAAIAIPRFLGMGSFVFGVISFSWFALANLG